MPLRYYRAPQVTPNHIRLTVHLIIYLMKGLCATVGLTEKGVELTVSPDYLLMVVTCPSTSGI